MGVQWMGEAGWMGGEGGKGGIGRTTRRMVAWQQDERMAVRRGGMAAGREGELDRAGRKKCGALEDGKQRSSAV